MLLNYQIQFGNTVDLNYPSGLMLCEGVEFAVWQTGYIYIYIYIERKREKERAIGNTNKSHVPRRQSCK